jgi:hypothetical protein
MDDYEDDDYGEIDYWQCDVDDPEHWRLRELQLSPRDDYDDDFDDPSDDYDDYVPSTRHATPAYTTRAPEPRRSFVKDGRVHSVTHGGFLEKRLHEMFLSSDQCDVTLMVGNSIIKAHKLILMANSDYFNAMFSSTWSDAQNGEISFQDNPYVTSVGLDAITEYVYSGSFYIKESSVREILEAARHFLMPNVTDLCIRFMEDIQITEGNFMMLFELAVYFEIGEVEERCELFARIVELNLDNYKDILVLAQACSSEDILENVLAFIFRELPDLIHSQELLEVMDASALHAMVRTDVLTDVTLLIDFIVKWVERAEGRTHYLAGLMADINLLCYDEDALDAIADMKCIREDTACRELIAAAKENMLEFRREELGPTKKEDTYIVSLDSSCMNLLSLMSPTAVKVKNILNMPNRNLHGSYIPCGGCSIVGAHDVLFICNGAYDSSTDEVAQCFLQPTLSLCYIFDPLRANWKVLASLTKSRVDFALVYLDGDVYIIGGNENSLPTSGIDIYNMKLDEWRIGTALPNASTDLVAAAHNGNIYVYAHETGPELFKYDPYCQLWETKTTPPFEGRRQSMHNRGSLASGNDCLYLFPKTEPVDIVYAMCYHPSTDQWTTLAIHSVGFFGLKHAVSSVGQIYINACREEIRTRVQVEGKNGIFHFDEANNSIKFMKEINFDGDFVVMNIPRRTVDRLKDIRRISSIKPNSSLFRDFPDARESTLITLL